jgi:hypothetical protein
MKLFLNQQIQYYKQSVGSIDLFQAEKQKTLTEEQKKEFVEVFYHIRGYLYQFLWYLGCQTKNTIKREMILKNFMEEFDHDQLYVRFAKSFDLDYVNEIIYESKNLDFVKNFNKGHVKFIFENDNISTWTLFSVYESLDNTDYNNLGILARTIAPENTDFGFFDVHTNAKHFEFLEESFLELWYKDQYKVMQSTQFVLLHQLQMWQNLSDHIFGLNPYINNTKNQYYKNQQLENLVNNRFPNTVKNLSV